MSTKAIDDFCRNEAGPKNCQDLRSSALIVQNSQSCRYHCNRDHDIISTQILGESCSDIKSEDC